MENKIKILEFFRNYIGTGEDKFILDISIKKLCDLIQKDGWQYFHRNVADKLAWSVAFWKQIDGLQIIIYLDGSSTNKNQTILVCKDWWTKECKKHFNLVK